MAYSNGRHTVVRSKKTSLPSGAPAERLTVREMPTERRKFDEEKLRKEEEQQKRKDHRLAEKRQRRPRSPFRRWKTSNSDAYRIFVIQARSEPEVVPILPTVSSIAAFFIS